jgi:hypothetical protein
MYNKIPTEIKPIETFAKITYASSFDPEFFLLLRERRSASLAHMKYVALEVESNILGTNKLRGKYDRDRRKSRVEASTSYSSGVNPQVDELTKLVQSLSIEMEKMKLEGKQNYRNTHNVDNRGNFRRQNNAPQVLQRDQRNRDEQKVQTPLQNNMVDEEVGEDEETDPKIHCVGDTSPSPHLNQSAYEESLMDNQLNELSKGEKYSENQNKYNLR